MSRIALAVFAILVFSLPAAAAGRGGLAAVDEFGVLVYGKNIRKAEQVAVGTYVVKFEKSIRGCYYFATHGLPRVQGVLNLSTVVSPFAHGTKNRVMNVKTFNPVGNTLLNHGFFLRVEC